MPPESKEPCSIFLAPDGKTFKTMDEVTIYAKVLDEKKLARDEEKLAKDQEKLVARKRKLDKAEASPSQSKDIAAKEQKLDTSNALPGQSKAAKEQKLDTSDALPIQYSTGKLKCSKCDNSFFNLSRLEKHFTVFHVEASQLPSPMGRCTICNMRLVDVLNQKA